MAKIFNRKQNKIKRQKSNTLLKDKRFILITTSISLGILLVGSNVVLSRKTYEIIEQKRHLDQLTMEKKDLDEEIETVVSPVAIKERANELGMVEIETIDELLMLGD